MATPRPPDADTAKLLRRRTLISLALAAVTLVIFWPAVAFDFVNYDDPDYVSENGVVQAGLTIAGIRWAFTSTISGNYHPLTCLSHMLDCQLFGLRPGWHHLTSILIHAANSVLLFLVLGRATKSLGRSAIVAALFAVHPLHVESVAWIAERKDVLSAFWGLLCLWFYVCYTEKNGKPGKTKSLYLAALSAFGLGLLSKPMLVTIPAVLCLIDIWPLRRWKMTAQPADAASTTPTRRLILEKLPFGILSVLCCVVTIWAQRSVGAMATAEALPFAVRIGNAVLSYVTYLGKAVFPIKLSVLYPLSLPQPTWLIVLGSGVLVLATLLVVRALPRRPYLGVGWFWFIGMLVPVIGLVQVGVQAMADRYFYLPSIGLFLAMVWGIADLSSPRNARVALAFAVASLAGFAVLARIAVGYWQNSETLFTQALKATSRNQVAHLNLALHLLETGRTETALKHYREALKLNPRSAALLNHAGIALLKAGQIASAKEYFEQALAMAPGSCEAHNNLGNLFAIEGRYAEATEHYSKALAANPDSAEVHNNLGKIQRERPADAIHHLTLALKLKPDYFEAHYNLAIALANASRVDEAMAQLEVAQKLRPGDADVLRELGLLVAARGQFARAAEIFEQALTNRPEDPRLWNNLGNCLGAQDKLSEAATKYRKACELDPTFAAAHFNYGNILLEQGRVEQAREEYQLALKFKPDYAEARQQLEKLR